MSIIELEEVSQAPANLRTMYLDSLVESQEFHVEHLVKKGRCFLMQIQGETAGYAVTHNRCLIEFFLKNNFVCLLPDLFDTVLDQSKSSSALVKSFDSQMVFACASRSSKVQTSGLLFRKRVDEKFSDRKDIEIRSGRKEDVDLILAVHDNFFEDANEVTSYLNESGIFLYFKEDELQGIGIMKRIIPGRNAFDIGMVVSPDSRRSGLGSYIVSHVKSFCISKGYAPVCGCSSDNIASRKSLEKAGFITGHSLLKFTYDLDCS